MCDKVPDDYLHVLKFVPNCYITQTMCDKSINTHRSVSEDAFFDTILPW